MIIRVKIKNCWDCPRFSKENLVKKYCLEDGEPWDFGSERTLVPCERRPCPLEVK